jgi:hypothetical protein
MADMLSILIHMIADALRKLWQKLTGRPVPVPVPVRVRRFSSPVCGDIFSRSSVNGLHASVADEFRLRL